MTARVLPVLAAALLAAPAAFAPRAFAQEVITGGESGAPPSARPAAAAPAQVDDPEQSPQAIGAWARGVMAGRPAGEAQLAPGAAPPGRCPAPPDKKPHGEVWAGVGTRGYREAGGVVTMPVGDCGAVTLAIDKTEFGAPRRR